ncbi:unnamed protein product [Allacma fusca]|uniref:LAIKA domain-containing protein n=1 Tax=Allacma fusca TaxID=39272 RepID=A0A8J2K131_9HEXA|nr:unnamed protein product [Allacma fusca]
MDIEEQTSTEILSTDLAMEQSNLMEKEEDPPDSTTQDTRIQAGVVSAGSTNPGTPQITAQSNLVKKGKGAHFSGLDPKQMTGYLTVISSIYTLTRATEYQDYRLAENMKQSFEVSLCEFFNEMLQRDFVFRNMKLLESSLSKLFIQCNQIHLVLKVASTVQLKVE